MHNALLRRVHVEQRNSELAAVFLQGLDLFCRDRIGDWQPARCRRNIVIHSGDRAQRLSDSPSISTQPVKSLRRSHFMDKVQVNIEQRGLPLRRGNYVRVPNLFKQGASWHRNYRHLFKRKVLFISLPMHVPGI